MDIIEIDGKTRPDGTKVALCLGNFDGLHLGHQELLLTARKSDYLPSILLFEPSAEALLFPERPHPVLTSLADKLRILPRYGIERAYVLHADLSFYALDPQGFVSFLKEKIDPSLIVCGTDFRFARNCEGNPALLRKAFPTVELPLLQKDGEKVSSTRIRRLIMEEGDVRAATSLLGRPYEMKGSVRHGLHNGTRIGFPTLNLLPSAPYCYPLNGVYEGVSYLSGMAYRSIINVGTNPTVGALSSPQVESHLLGFEGDAYGKTLYVSFERRLRGEKKFASLEELQKQIEHDKEAVLRGEEEE